MISLKHLFAVWAGSILSLGCIWAQPNTDIYLLKAQQIDSVSWTFSEARNLTPRQGYDNQPSFTPDGQALLFVSIDDQAQADVYRYSLNRGSTERLTDTRRSEYSPQVTPKGDGFTAVVVEEDSAQRLWFFEWGDRKGTVLLDELPGIGYYAFYHKKKIAAFYLGEPQTLDLIHLRKQRPSTLIDSVGRCLQAIPNTKNQFSYVDLSKASPEIWQYDAKKKLGKKLASCLEDSEDYAWTPDGRLIMAQRSQLYLFDPDQGTEWLLLQDLELGPISRLALSPDGKYLSVVVQK